jgi:hypothetical protein
LSYARRARQAARDAKQEQAGREETNKSVENEFDKMSVVSFEIVEEDVMEGGSARMAILTHRKNNQVKIAAAPTLWKQHPLQTIKC